MTIPTEMSSAAVEPATVTGDEPAGEPAMSRSRLESSRDGRLIVYCVVTLGGFGTALAVGQPALAALAVPFALALVAGLSRTAPLEVDARMVLDADQVLEDDVVGGRVEIEWSGGPLDVQVLVTRLNGVTPVEPGGPVSWSTPVASPPVTLPFQVHAAHWGRHVIGEVWIRARSPYGLVSWSGKIAPGATLRILPSSDRLTRLLDPAESRAVAGMHRSGRIGDGAEFAELRPYTPGDRLRDLNWGATARHGQPFVNRYHPELSGEVVIVVDAFTDGSADATEALARAARAAWAVASIHLQANDRVGLVGIGRRTLWLHPAGGRRAKYELLEALLSIGGDAAGTSNTEHLSARGHVPASALVVGLTPLHDRRMISMLQSWRAHGRSVAVAMIDTRDLLGDVASPAEALARRLWSMELDRHQRELADVAIPVVTVSGDAAVAPIISALRRARQAPSVRRS